MNLIACLLFNLMTICLANGQLMSLRQAAEAHQKDMSFGTSVRYWVHQNTDQVEYRAYSYIQYNSITPEAHCKMHLIQPDSRYSYDWSGCDYIYNLARDNDLELSMHTMIWGQYIPDWLNDGGYSASEIQIILIEFVTAFVNRYVNFDITYATNSINKWDVVNEAILDVPNLSTGNIYKQNLFYNMLGSSYIGISFLAARHANSDIKLFYNDYNIIMTSTWMQNKADAVYGMISDMIENGIPIDGIGFQCHLFVQHYDAIINSWDRVIANLQRFSDLGLEIHITEVDVDCGYWDNDIGRRVPCDSFTSETEEKQAEIYQFLLNVCLYVDACTSFTMWGITDRHTWLDGHYPLPFDSNYQPKLAAHYMLDTLVPGAQLYHGLVPLVIDDTSDTSNNNTYTTTDTDSDENTLQPTVFPTITPTDGDSGDMSNNCAAIDDNCNIIIKNHNNINPWWAALYLDNLEYSNGVQVNEIIFEFRDNQPTADWVKGDLKYWGQNTPFVFRNIIGRAWQLPLDVRLTNDYGDGEVLIGYDVITTFDGGAEFDFGDFFGFVTSQPVSTVTISSSTTGITSTVPDTTTVESTATIVTSTSAITDFPTIFPTIRPTISPTNKPSDNPTDSPTGRPTVFPTSITIDPTIGPTNDPTARPTTSPTVTTTDSSVSTTDETKHSIIVQNGGRNNRWWGSYFLSNVEGVELSDIVFEIADNGGSGAWTTGTLVSWGMGEPFVVRNKIGRGWELPLTVRLTSDSGSGQVLLATHLITSFDSWMQFDFGDNFN